MTMPPKSVKPSTIPVAYDLTRFAKKIGAASQNAVIATTNAKGTLGSVEESITNFQKHWRAGSQSEEVLNSDRSTAHAHLLAALAKAQEVAMAITEALVYVHNAETGRCQHQKVISEITPKSREAIASA